MDELLDIAQKTMDKFNPETDSADNYEEIPDGTYKCLLEEVTFKKSQNGTPNISFKYSILDGEYENRFLFDNHYFTVKTAEWQTKKVKQIAYRLGFELPQDTFSSFQHAAEVFNNMAGTQANIKKTTNKSGYANCEIIV